jgi:hypothetical protein
MSAQQPPQSDNAIVVPNPVGRPKRTLSELSENWKIDVLTLMSQGGSRIEVMTLLGISKDLFYRWLEEEDEFSETIKEGDKACEAWWVSAGRLNLKDRNFSPVLWYMNMKNRFWLERPTRRDQW